MKKFVNWQKIKLKIAQNLTIENHTKNVWQNGPKKMLEFDTFWVWTTLNSVVQFMMHMCVYNNAHTISMAPNNAAH